MVSRRLVSDFQICLRNTSPSVPADCETYDGGSLKLGLVPLFQNFLQYARTQQNSVQTLLSTFKQVRNTLAIAISISILLLDLEFSEPHPHLSYRIWHHAWLMCVEHDFLQTLLTERERPCPQLDTRRASDAMDSRH
jgi:hypothetical protein